MAIPLGAAVGLWRPPRPRVASLVQHFAAGLLIGAVALELLAPVSHGSALAAVVGVAGGLLAVLLLDTMSLKLTGGEESGGMGLALVVAAAAQDLRLALLLAIGLMVEDFFTTLSLIIGLHEAASRKKTIWITAPSKYFTPVGSEKGRFTDRQANVARRATSSC